MKTSLKSLLPLVLFIIVSASAFSQEKIEDKRLKIETEPGLFFNEGRSLGMLYNVTKDNNFGVGLYVLSSNVPDAIADDMFDNYNDSLAVRVTEEYAVYLRYRIRISKEIESNPYVGLIAGWENFELTREGLDDLDIGTFIITPHIGYELFAYKQILYVNTQIRVPIYVGQKKSDELREEALKPFTLLPSISIGFRF